MPQKISAWLAAALAWLAAALAWLAAGLTRLRLLLAQKLVGLRTLLVAACLVVLDVLSATDVMPIVPEALRPWWMVAQPIVFMALRFVTTGPVKGRGDA